LRDEKKIKRTRILLTMLAGIAIVIIVLIIASLMNRPPQKDEVQVYFSKMSGADVIVEPVKRVLPKGQNPLSYSIAELMEGPSEEEKDKGFFSEIPVGTKVISIEEKAGEVRINLNKQFASGGGSNSMISRLKELSLTALDAEPVRKIYLDIDGNQLEMLGGEGLEVVQPLKKENFIAVEQNE
jgi:spore germination protein GerM